MKARMVWERWLSATEGQGAPPKTTFASPKIFEKTIKEQ